MILFSKKLKIFQKKFLQTKKGKKEYFIYNTKFDNLLDGSEEIDAVNDSEYQIK